MSGRFVVIVLDSVGIGELPDAALYGDRGSNTLVNLSRAVGGVNLPNLEKLGLGKIASIIGLDPDRPALGAFGKMAALAPGKDSITGHWELMGFIAEQPQPTFPKGFPDRIILELERQTGTKFLGNIPASGTEIIRMLGAEHLRTGYPILYTSADSVLQIAAHEDVIPISKLYDICRIARRIMQGKDAVGRIIARPFIGEPGGFVRTANRRDFSLEPPGKTTLDLLVAAEIRVMGIGKIEDLFAGRGLTDVIHTASNKEGLQKTHRILTGDFSGMIFTNLVDFDMLWGHRNDAAGYYRGLQMVDDFLPEIYSVLRTDDVLVLTADHGCDPTTPSTDHSREYVPILVFGKRVRADHNLKTRETFADLGATIADFFGIQGTGAGKSFWKDIQAEMD